MSEGVQDEAGRPLAKVLAGEAVERDAHGNLQLTSGDLGIEIQKALKSRFPRARARVDTLGYLPRGYIGVIDETDREEAFAAGALRLKAP
jgi:6-phosphofructokinase 1